MIIKEASVPGGELLGRYKAMRPTAPGREWRGSEGRAGVNVKAMVEVINQSRPTR